MAPQNTTRKLVLTDEHKAALRRGREEAKIVKDYLTSLKQNRPKRGRRRTLSSIKKQIEIVNNKITSSDYDGTAQLKLIQQRIDLMNELDAKQKVSFHDEAEMAFVAIAKSFSERQGISRAAWEGVGVPTRVLRAAGIKK